MIQGNQSISNYDRGNIAIWMMLCFQAGMINVGGFLACHRFVSHVTGFAGYFGMEASRGNSLVALEMLIVPIFFLLGSGVSGLLVDVPLKLQRKPKYYITFGIIFAILLMLSIGGTLGAFGEFGSPMDLPHDYVLLILLCAICGLINGTVTTVSKSVVRTTHLTGIVTDLGIGLVRYGYRKTIGEAVAHEGRANLMRLGIILAFVLGSLAAGFIFHRFGYLGFYFPTFTAGVLFSTMIYFQFLKTDPQR